VTNSACERARFSSSSTGRRIRYIDIGYPPR
jgi:hypothetical protein